MVVKNPLSRKMFFPLLILLAIAGFLTGVLCGSEFLSIKKLFFPEGKFSPTLLAKGRLLQSSGAFLAGSSLALAGAAYQAVLRNILAEPYILGVSSGSALGAAIAFISGAAMIFPGAVTLFAAAGALFALFLVLSLGFYRKNSSSDLLLSGVIVGTLLSSCLMAAVTLASSREMYSLTWFLLGDLSALDPAHLVFSGLSTLIFAFILFLFSSRANLLALGEEYAYSMGISPRKNAFWIILTASLLAAQTVALCGIIGFVGLIIPHIIRKLYKADNRKLFPAAFLAGGTFLLFCDTLSRSIFPEREIPIGVITALVGGPLFLVLLRKKWNSGGKNE